MTTLSRCLAAVAMLGSPFLAQAGYEMKEVNKTVAETPFDKGKFEYQTSSGAYFSVGGGDRPTLNYSSSAVRLGVMLYTPDRGGCLRGNLELLIQAIGGSVFDGPGNYFGEPR